MADSSSPTVRLGDHDYPVWFLLHSGSHLEEAVLAIDAADRLGYLAAAQEWTDLSEPLPDAAQHVADELSSTGRLSIYVAEVPDASR